MMVCLAAPSTESPAGDPRAAETESAADARAKLFLVFSLSLVAGFVRPNGLSTWTLWEVAAGKSTGLRSGF